MEYAKREELLQLLLLLSSLLLVLALVLLLLLSSLRHAESVFTSQQHRQRKACSLVLKGTTQIVTPAPICPTRYASICSHMLPHASICSNPFGSNLFGSNPWLKQILFAQTHPVGLKLFGSRSQLGSNKLFWLKPFWLKQTLLAQASPFGPNKPFLAQTLLAQTFFGSNPFGSNPLLLKQTPLPYILQLYAPPCRDRQGRRPRHYDRFQKQFSKTA